MQFQTYGRLTYLLGLNLFFSLGYIFTHGFYSFPGAVIILVSIILFFLFLFDHQLVKLNVNKSKFIQIISFFLFLNIIFTIVLYGGLYQTVKPAVEISNYFLGLAFIVSSLLLLKPRPRNIKWILLPLFVIWLILHLLMVLSSPEPKIDVYEILNKAPYALIKGQNPYSIEYKRIYTNTNPDHFAYFPFMIFFVTPFVLLFHDPRLSLIFAQAVTAAILIFIYKWQDKKFGYIFSLLLASMILFHPLSLYITEQSYTEPLILLLLVLLFYSIYSDRESKISSLMLGICLATKQYLIFLLPFLYKERKFKNKYIFYAFLAFSFLVLPFLLLSASDFIHDTATIHFSAFPRYEGLTFFSLIFQLFGVRYVALSALVIWLLAVAVLLKKKANSLSDSLYKLTLFLLIFFYFNKYAYINHYFLFSNLFMFYIFAKTLELQD